ncbi:MAG: GNAT family N-acetyltransferase [Ruminococcus sp.]|nr:GNAT family N-acetyltransferase [Ruminococcus sp.]
MSIFSIPTIETERLILRPLTIEDAEAVFEWTGDPRVAKYMIYSTHPDILTTKTWLSSLCDLENEYTWGFVRKSDGKLIGSGSIRFRTDENRWSFGYNVRYDCWNMGYTTEAVLKMMDFVRSEHGARNFVAEHAVDNPASGRVIEKCGLHFVKYGEYTSFDGTKIFKAKIYELNEGE